MSVQLITANHGMPWEESFGYSQALSISETIYISGQLAHDEEGNLVGEGDFATQMRVSFANIDKLLAKLGATKNQIVSDLVAVVGLRTHFQAVIEEHHRYFGDHRPASTTIGVVELALPGQLVEIAVTVRLDAPA